ncbi:unnamed protein product [Prunus brigantina]
MSSPLKLNLYKPIKHIIPSSCAILLLLCKTDISNFPAASPQLLSASTARNSAQLLCSQQLLFFATTNILLILSFLIILCIFNLNRKSITERAFSCMRIIESTSKHHM